MEAAQTAALLVLFLAPWWGMSLRWCGTFLFPFVRGNFNADYAYFQPYTRFEKLHTLWAHVTYCLPVKGLPLILVAALVARRRERPVALSSFALAAFAGFALLIEAYPDGNPPDMSRYHFGFTFAALLAIALETTAGGHGNGRARTESTAALALVVAALALQIYGDREATMHTFDKALSAIEPDIETPAGWTPRQPDANYKKLQDAIPEGEPIAVMVDEFGNFDFERNRIESLDMVGAISPRPGLPLHEGPDAVADYLASQGYRYAIVVHPEAAAYLYRRDTWVKNAANGDPIWKRSAGHYIAAFDDFDALRKSRVHVADAGPMTALDLTRRAE
jgi:hypothetical protein